MASANVKKSCATCAKSAGVATCDGCQQSFCSKHFTQHRQELSNQMENIGQEHDLLRRDLDQDRADHYLLSRINTWEQESIFKIQVAAEAARADLHGLLDRNKQELRKSVAKITDELQACRESDDYTEMDIKNWSQQLQSLRKMLESPFTIRMDENDTSKSVICLIRVRDQQQHRSPYTTIQPVGHSISAAKDLSSSPNERFEKKIGDGLIFEEGLVITCQVTSLFPLTAYGVNRYSSGRHLIRFRIDRIGHLHIFLGITTSKVNVIKAQNSDLALSGWWDLVKVFVNGTIQRFDNDNVVRTGDEMTLILDCDNQQIQLQHHRTNLSREVSIDINNCPFPWKIVVKLKSNGDSVRILQ